jgi:hypothetical protein
MVWAVLGDKILLPLPEIEPRIVEPLITVLTTLFSAVGEKKSTERTILLPEELVL